MDRRPVEEILPDGSGAPLVRPTRSQPEVALLPPYGDPEVSIPGEVATYVVLGGLSATVLGRLAE